MFGIVADIVLFIQAYDALIVVWRRALDKSEGTNKALGHVDRYPRQLPRRSKKASHSLEILVRRSHGMSPLQLGDTPRSSNAVQTIVKQ